MKRIDLGLKNIFMQQKILLFLFLFLVIIFLFVIPKFKNFNFHMRKGMEGTSADIGESKKRGVFVYEYLPPQNPYKINDSLAVRVKSAWLEHKWTYTGPFNTQETSIDSEGYTLIVISDEKSLKGLDNNWLIGAKKDSTFYGGYGSSMTTNFDKLPTTDTIVWKVQSGNHGFSTPKIIIGKFSLVVIK